jgi:hypothetical protein
MNLFNKWRRQMCSFIGIPPGPWLGKGGCQVVRGDAWMARKSSSRCTKVREGGSCSWNHLPAVSPDIFLKPLDAGNALTPLKMTLNACDMKYSKPNVYGKATWYGIFDGTQGQVGDYFVGIGDAVRCCYAAVAI